MKKQILKKDDVKKLTEQFDKIIIKAMSSENYEIGVRKIEQMKVEKKISENKKIKLALLYDHLAYKLINSFNKKEGDIYLNKALDIYKEVARKNPNNMHAIFGIGRIWHIKRYYKKSLKYKEMAYDMMLKLPLKQRGALGIGAMYEEIGNLKKAKEWYLREYKDTPRNDFGSLYNLIIFYERSGEVTKVGKYLNSLERIFKKEFNRNVYRGSNIKKSLWVRSVKDTIKRIKKACAKTGSN